MLKKGDTYSKTIIFKQEDVETFARITGDHNPIHVDREYAAQSVFKKTVVHGMLAASSFSGVLGVAFPGKGSIVTHRALTFVRPVFVDEEYSMHFKILEVNYTNYQGLIKTTMKNPKGQICITMISKILNPVAFASR